MSLAHGGPQVAACRMPRCWNLGFEALAQVCCRWPAPGARIPLSCWPCRWGGSTPRTQQEPEEIVPKQRSIDVMVAQGTPPLAAFRSIGVSRVTFPCRRDEFRGLTLDRAKAAEGTCAEEPSLVRGSVPPDRRQADPGSSTQAGPILPAPRREKVAQVRSSLNGCRRRARQDWNSHPRCCVGRRRGRRASDRGHCRARDDLWPPRLAPHHGVPRRWRPVMNKKGVSGFGDAGAQGAADSTAASQALAYARLASLAVA